MRALPERGTIRPYTDAELDRLHVPPQVVAQFLAAIIMSRGGTVRQGFYPAECPRYTPGELPT